VPSASALHSHAELQPPYVGYRRFRTVLDREAWGATPQVADRLANALQFFGLVSRDLGPEWELRRFARADTHQRRQILRDIVVSRFRWVKMLPANTSQEDFRSVLAGHCSLTGESLTRAASFVVSASRDLDIEIPIVPTPRGPRPKSSSSHVSGTPDALPPGLNRGVESYFAFLREQAQRSARRGEVDRDLLDRLDRLSLAILNRARSTDAT
jgi:hypothetical protein